MILLNSYTRWAWLYLNWPRQAFAANVFACCFLLLFIVTFTSIAQVKVGTTPGAAHPSAQLEVQSTNKGLLLPRNTSPQANIPNPTAGLMAYNETSNSPQYYNGSSWVDMGGLYKEFPNAIVFRTNEVTAELANSVKTYSISLPANTKKIWMELWSGGGSGSVMGISPGNPMQYSGGDGGSYLSATATFTSNNTNLIISVGKGSSSPSFRGGNYSAVTLAAVGTVLALVD